MTIAAPNGGSYSLAIAGAGTQGGFALSQAPSGGTRLTTTNAPITLDTVQGESGGTAQFLGALASPPPLDGSANGGMRLSALLRDEARLLDPAASLTGSSTVATGAAPGVNGGSPPLPLLSDAAAAAPGLTGLHASAGGLLSPTAAMSAFASTSAGFA